ncbi:hypothetical protein DQ239_14830 [Blastococcus sp. TF02-09]|uniref:hypothetical protein n=1 Tax=Blastococcus sp. TF02-09 TaxID=2250576 RepID=UPI000DE84BC0|nr:hypothetical protein [Blastococcus sp. TF02-9]RBY76254.1 hypothetical protein DQ239_14830 [Blastococcus sp. TF02-9]
MTSEFGQPPSDAPSGPVPGLAQAGSPWFSEPDGPRRHAPDLPSRRTTVLVTAFFGLFGLIPASRHSRQAEQLGVSGSRYYTAFALTLAAGALTWTLVAALLVTLGGNASPTEPTGATAATSAAGERADEQEKYKARGVGGLWTVERLVPALEWFADDEYPGDNEFTGVYGALIPCGGQHVHGLAPDVMTTTLGGYGYVASAQVLPDPAAAERELDRQTELLRNCTAGYELEQEGGGVATCMPSVQAFTPVVRYQDTCTDGSPPYTAAIFRTDNAVVTVLTTADSELDWMLNSLMLSLE